MSEQTQRILEICFFILSLGLLVQEPAALLVNAIAYTAFAKPILVTIILISVPMVYASVIRILGEGKFFINLFAGVVYFVNIVRWIEVI